MASFARHYKHNINNTVTEKQSETKEQLSNECLLDGFLALYDECTHDNILKIKNASSFVKKYNMAVNLAKRERRKVSDFEVKAIIGRGHFGEVRVVREKATDEVYAMKVLRKSDLLAQPEISFFEEERDIMGKSTSPWITRLHFAFQDSINLYLVMDFHAGGDLLSLLSRHDDILDEGMAKFYIAEMAIAINSLHEMGYLHRDIKPENVLLDCTGHIKLADFGSAAKLDKDKKVCAHMPVGTPDYVAPELLVSMNKGPRRVTYGPEVDWWSLGVCAFEMLFGATPFTSEHCSMVSTYANIMEFKKTLKFPTESDVSSEAKDFICKLLTDSDSRLGWQEIKSHPFLSGIKWDTIRESEAIYVPSIHGLDDTSHFDEVEKVERQPDIDVLKPQADFTGRDLPFVGFTFSKNSSARTTTSSSASDVSTSHILNTACLLDQTASNTSVVGMDSHALQVIAEKDQEIQKLRRILETERKHWNEVETRSVSLLDNLNSMNSEIRSFEDELLEVKLEEMKGEIILLESEQEKLSAQLRAKEQQLAKTQIALDEATEQLQAQQLKLDKERRKSREDQRKDLMLLELRNETWESLLEEKQATIDDLATKLRELEDLIEAYEDSEEKQALEVQQLHHKMNTSLPDLSSTLTLTDMKMSGDTGEATVELDNFHHSMCPSRKKLTLHVTVKAGRCSFMDNKTVHKLQDLQKVVDKYAESAREWLQREEELTAKLATLESENNMLRQKEGMGRKMKDSLMDKVTIYQQEVETQKGIIKELQESMRSYLSKTSTLSDTERKFKEVQQSKLSLEEELMSLKEEAAKTRQSALQKTHQMEEAIRKLEEQRALAQDYKNRYDCQVEVTEAKMRSIEGDLAKVTADRQRLERREASLTTQLETLQGLLDDRNLEMEKLERRNTDIQTHLQQLQQRNTELQVQVESLQKASAKSDEQQQSKAELNFHINRLQQQNTDLERRITTAIRDKQSLDDKITLVEREKERLMRRIERLEASENEKHELESKMEKMSALERENRRLEMKVERLSSLEKDKLNLEEKLDKLQLDLRKEKITIDSLTTDKKTLETKLAALQNKKMNDSNEEVAKLKMKVTLLETTEREKVRLENQLQHMKAEREQLEKEKIRLEALKEQKEKAVKEKEKVEQEKENLQKQKDTLEKEKQLVEKKLGELKREKTVSDEHAVKLNKEIDRLEHSLGKLQEHKTAEDSEVSKLSFEITRLKKLVDKLEQDKSQHEKDVKRSSVEIRSSLIDRLQRENADLRKQVLDLEKQVGGKDKSGNRRTSLALLQEGSSLRKVRQESDEKVKRLETEISDLKKKLRKQEQELDSKEKDKSHADELETKNKSQEEKISTLTEEVREKKKEVEELKSRLEVQTANVAELRAEVEELMKTENDLLAHLEKEALNAKSAHDEKEKLMAQLKAKESEDSTKGPKRAVTEAIVKDRQINQLTQEKNELEAKVTQLQRQIAQAKKSSAEYVDSARRSGEQKFEKIQQDTKIRELTEERDELQRKLSTMKSPAGDSELVKDLQQQLEECKKEMEIRKCSKEFSGGDIPAYLRHELNESNLALSEARSLLAASKRQELELRDRIDKLQRILDNKAVENGRYLQNSQDAMAELRSLKSQHDTLQRQYKVLEDKYASVQKEKGSNSSETVRLMEDLNSKHQQYEMECKKVEQLTKVCAELEDQVKDMEMVIVEFKNREAEWDNIKKTYEKAVDERENELEGAANQLQAVSKLRSDASEKMSAMRQQLESVKALHRAEIEKLNHSLREEQGKVKKLMTKMSELQDKDKSSEDVFASQMRELEKSNQEKMKMKEELTELLSDNCTLRKENLKLKKHLDEAMDKFELIIGEKVSLENFTEALQGLHFLDKYKFESTIGQQMKLIDYLQDLYMEHTGKKKKSKFFGSKTGSKDGTLRLSSVPLSWTDLQTALEQERSKSTILQEQVDKLREENYHQANDLLKMKQSSKEERNSGGIDRVRASVSLKVNSSALNALTHSPASQPAEIAAASSTASLASHASTSSSSSGSANFGGSGRMSQTPRSHKRGHMPDGRAPWMSEPIPTPQRMHHNIPHRFVTGLNTRATKCGLCLGTVHFVRQASKCQECSMVVHPKCAASVPATCGLPTEYVRHFALMMNRIYRDQTGRESEIDETAVKMEGWLKVPRQGKPGWENRYCVLEGTWLTLYLDDQDANPVDSFDLSPVDADVSVHSAVTSAELTNTASSDLHYVLRLDQDPLTTCWPGRYLYLMTTNFQEKQRWVASLEAVVKSAQCKNDLYRNRSQMLTVMSLKDADRRDFNCTLAISHQLVLVGTDDGLYAFNPQALTSKRKQMTQLTGFGSVHQMALAKGVDLILLLTGPERRLVMLENKLVKCRMSQTLGGETTPFSFRMIEGLQCCTIFDVGLWNNASYLCVGTPTKVYLMKYNPSLSMYCVRKEFPSSEPCSCVCIADNYAIVGTERFYKINLEHPSLLDFVDRQDSSLAFAAYGAANHHSFPLAVVRVSPENLPLEFLLCFHEFGVFVDHHGQRSRATDVKWSGLPLAFAFVDPFLYVTYTNTIQATVVPTDKTQAKGRQTVIDVQSPRYLGPAPSSGCVYISTSNNTTNVTEIICIRGQEEFSSDSSSDKENNGSTKTPSDKQVHFVSPRKTPKSHRLRRQGSFTSLNSNSSGSTFASVESDV